MDKKVLSEIDIYLGTVDMPKYFEINRDELKSNLLSSVVKDKSFKNFHILYCHEHRVFPINKLVNNIWLIFISWHTGCSNRHSRQGYTIDIRLFF